MPNKALEKNVCYEDAAEMLRYIQISRSVKSVTYVIDCCCVTGSYCFMFLFFFVLFFPSRGICFCDKLIRANTGGVWLPVTEASARICWFHSHQALIRVF